MKTIPLIVATAGILSLGALRASANLEVSAGVSVTATAEFEAPLAASGTWIEVGSYGRCWHPASVAVGWRPYCNGYWEWTDCGWYWYSDEPWGWACYHYGTWVFDPGFGWVWVPGTEWAPAWVEWRVGGGYIGWVPLAPPGVIVAPSLFVFVDAGHFTGPVRPSTVIVNKTTIINNTTVINKVTRENRDIGGRSQAVFVNNGPDVSMVEKATGKTLAAAPVQKVDQKTFASVPEKFKSRAVQPVPNEKPMPMPAVKPPVQPQQPSQVKPAPQPGFVPNIPSTPPESPGPNQGNGRDKDKGWDNGGGGGGGHGK